MGQSDAILSLIPTKDYEEWLHQEKHIQIDMFTSGPTCRYVAYQNSVSCSC